MDFCNCENQILTNRDVTIDTTPERYVVHKECGAVIKCAECSEPALAVNFNRPECGDHDSLPANIITR
jgi:hypothetical protein